MDSAWNFTTLEYSSNLNKDLSIKIWVSYIYEEVYFFWERNHIKDITDIIFVILDFNFVIFDDTSMILQNLIYT